jgi:inactive STAND
VRNLPRIWHGCGRMVNRANQELILNGYVRAVLERQIARPGFFLLRGREDECGDVFIERVARHSVPKVLRAAALREYVHLDQVVWPDHRDDIENSADAAEARYEALLGSAQEALARARQRAAQGTVLRVQLPVDDWRRSDRALLQRFVKWGVTHMTTYPPAALSSSSPTPPTELESSGPGGGAGYCGAPTECSSGRIRCLSPITRDRLLHCHGWPVFHKSMR